MNSAPEPARLDAIVRSDGVRELIDWVYPGAEGHTWVFDSEHFDEPLTPMELWCYRWCGNGIDRAWDEWQLVPPNVFIRWQFAGPFLCANDSPSSPERRVAIRQSFARLMEEWPSVRAFWEEWCEPRARTVCERLASGDGEPLADLADAWGYAWHQTFTSYTAPDLLLDELCTMLEAALGSDGALLAQELALGGTNVSQMIDAEVWALARLVVADPPLAALVNAGSPAEASAALRAQPTASPFLDRFDALVTAHAGRSEGWDLMRPTWGERPELVVALVRSQLAGGVAPDDLAADVARRRDAALARALRALPASAHDRCRELVAALDGYIGIREGRAYWQMSLTGQLRLLLLRHGARLAAAHRIAQADDVFFLEPPEFECTTGWLGDLVAERRAAYEAWRATTPPTQVGVLAPDQEVPASDRDDELIGLAASRGVVTAIARIIHDPDDWDRLAPGEILVCQLSTPTWTPLFAIASGIVTESGNAYAHPAITAREYGIPAVVAVRDACTKIRDGQTITVDGAAGRVSLGE